MLVAGGLFSYLQNVEQRVTAVQATDKRINLAPALAGADLAEWRRRWPAFVRKSI
ncbi:hypothetical protein J4714_14220 [Staphylococcus epidermidis]|nr:hypothetical protein [Staphylococcus epidermidis]